MYSFTPRMRKFVAPFDSMELLSSYTICKSNLLIEPFHKDIEHSVNFFP